MEIFDLGKWHNQTIEHVKHALDKADAPCVGYCLLFMDFKGEGVIEWKYKPFLAFDPNNPPPKEDRERLEEIFDRFGELAQTIMSGGEDARRQ